MSLIAITRLRLRYSFYLPPFWFYSILSTLQAKHSPGNLGVGILVDVNNTFWTRTVWQDEISMRSFVTASFHHQVMSKLYDWADEASVVHWEQEVSDFPTWQEAHQRMIKEGFYPKLKYSSPTHTVNEIAVPQIVFSIVV